MYMTRPSTTTAKVHKENPPMKRSHFWHVLALLIILPLAITACGDSSSDKEVAATNFPYGADSTLTSISDRGDTLQVTYDYNQAVQVIGVETIVEEYGDIDGNDGVVYRRVNTMTVDPSITAEYDMRNSVAKIAQGARPMGISFGAITSLIESRYELNEETGILETTPSRKTEYRYKYSASGQLLEDIRIETEDMEATTYTDSYSYNAAGDLTREEDTTTYPSSVNSSFTRITVIEYDSHGNPISNVYTQEGDQDGDGTDDTPFLRTTTFVNSYENNLLTRTVTTATEGESPENTYQIEYTYNTQSQLISSTTSTDQYNDDDIYDTFKVHTYTYDSAGRLLSDLYEHNYDNNNDEILNYLSRNNQVWEYNQDGLMVSSYSEDYNYADPSDETLSSHYKDQYTYQYTNNGNISRRTYERLQDSDLDGECEVTLNDRSYEYSYNSDNYLSGYTRVSHDYIDGEISSTYTDEQTLTYTDGVLTEVEMNETDSYSDEPYSSLTSLSYDDSEKFIGYEAQHNNGTETINLTYNDNQIVSFSFLSDDEEHMTMEVDFSTEGLPSGTDNFAPDPLTIRYPNTPGSNDHLNDLVSRSYSPADDNDKVYPFNVKIPKMLMFVYNAEMGGK
jgi:hypothetical protein